jgi:polysaccharide transporter, PST family
MSVAKNSTFLETRPARSLSNDSLALGIVFALVLTLVQRLLGGVRGVVFCRLMTDQELGQWSLLNSFLMILGPFAVLGLPGSFGKFVEHYFQQGQLRSFLRRVGWLCTATTILVAGSIWIMPGFFSQQILGEPDQVGLMRLMSATLVALTAFNYLTSLIESMRQIRLATILRFVSGVSFTLLGIVLLLVSPNGSISATWAFLLSCVLGSVPAVWFLWNQRQVIVDEGAYLDARQMWFRLTPYALWWWASNMVFNLFELSDRYMLIHYSRAEWDAAQALVGQYHSGRIIPLLMVGVASMLSGLLLPYVAKSWSDGNIAKACSQLNWTIKLSTIGMMAANVVLLFGAPLIFNTVLDGRYNDGLSVLPLTMVYCTWFSIITVSQDFLWVSENGKYAVATMAIGLVANIWFNMLLIPSFGLWGAVAATSIGNLLGLVLLFLANQRFRCRPDFGCWMAVLLPVLLLLPAMFAAVGFVLFSIFSAMGTWVFSKAEKQEISELFQSQFLARFQR